jgi:catechol 2,3-dioxygenase-like lactoylglutathione lyase family enzyme
MRTTNQSLGIEGGVATVFVRDMDVAFQFYTETLGLSASFRAGNHFAMIDAGHGFMIGLHPAGEDAQPGLNGGVQIGLSLEIPIRQAVDALKARGVEFLGDVQVDANGGVKLAFFKDPDGNELYLVDTKH